MNGGGNSFAGATVLITGASSGIGKALAEECAKRGAKRLFLGGRDAGRLELTAANCGGVASVRVVDVTDERGMAQWISECDAQSPLDFVFANAGTATGIECGENVRNTFAVNVGGCLNTVLPTIGAFRRRARGQIVITSSMTAYAPLPTCASYAATKAAVKSWGLALRGALRKEGIGVNVVCPGFVRSRITDMNTCPMPFFMEAEKAARIILDRVERNVGLIAFPWQLRLVTWLLGIVPWRVAELISGMLPPKTDS